MATPREIPFFNYPALFKERETELMDIIHDVLSRGAYILQADLEEFEHNLAEFLNVKHVIGVADGTNALKLALMASDIEPGDEIIVPSHTYVASVAAIHYAGAKAVLVECGEDHLIDTRAIESAITTKTKAIMPVQLNGRTADMATVGRIATDHNLKVVEDAAQALGSKFNKQSAGTFGNAGTFSFYPAKLLGCFGDGGAVVTNSDETAQQLNLLRDHGRDENGEVVAWGTNSRLDNMQAAVLNFKLKHFPEDIKRRRQIAKNYSEGLSMVSPIKLPPDPVEGALHYDVYQNYEIEAARRDELKAYLGSQGIGTIIQFGGKPVHKFPLGFQNAELPITENLYEKMLLLPMHTALSDTDVAYIIEKIQVFYN